MEDSGHPYQQHWYGAQGNSEGSIANLEINETTGGSVDDPRPPSTVPVGTTSIDFSDCRNAVLNYALPHDELDGQTAPTPVIPSGVELCVELVE